MWLNDGNTKKRENAPFCFILGWIMTLARCFSPLRRSNTPLLADWYNTAHVVKRKIRVSITKQDQVT
ncbi:hypothetical protein WM46_07970 [Citrobacter freundii complex sp. CFNIH2]|nr:hypothetical protein WM46_07970 [Citrobacter freundii complex sp. CFNIH2]